MGISSAAEAKLEASIRPEITVLRARTSYPRRHRPALAALPGAEPDAAARALPGGPADAAVDDSADAGTPAGGAGSDDTPIVRVLATVADPAPGTARVYRSSSFTSGASFTSEGSITSARTVRTATSAASVRTARIVHAGRQAAPSRPGPAAPRTPAQSGRAPRASASQGREGRHAATAASGSTAGRIGASGTSAGREGVAARGAQPAPVRLTRRGRLVVGLLAGLAIASAVALIWLAVTGQAQATGKVTPGSASNHGMLRVVVRPGQTLWNIAEKADPSADPRLVIQQIIDDNALSGTAVNAGQVLWVPRS
jgi:LysM domain